MAQRPYIALVSRDFYKMLCLWSHDIAFKMQPFVPRWLKCREAIVAVSQCGTVNVVEFHLGLAASSNTCAVWLCFCCGCCVFFSWTLTWSTVWCIYLQHALDYLNGKSFYRNYTDLSVCFTEWLFVTDLAHMIYLLSGTCYHKVCINLVSQ